MKTSGYVVISLYTAYTYDWAMLEPIMTVEVNAPQEYQGSVLAGLTKRNAIFLGTDSNEGYFTSYCEVEDFCIMSLYESTIGNYLLKK